MSQFIEYAKSNRSTCKGCKTKIDKDILRIGTIVQGPDYDMTHWRHVGCTKRPPGLFSLVALPGSECIRPADLPLVEAWLADDKATLTVLKRKADVATAEAAAAGPATPKKAKASGAGSSYSTPVKSAHAVSIPLDQEMSARDDATAVFSRLSIPHLKNCLRANDQLLGGAKAELVERCVDRKLFGNLPRCPECGIGKLKVAYPRALGHGGQGLFTCPGGYDDDEYKRCSFRTGEIARPAWRVQAEEANAPPPKAAKSGGGKSKAAKALWVD